MLKQKIMYTLAGVLLFTASSLYLLKVRGYFAVGGEIMLLLTLPVLMAILEERK